jgi:hypothetical protein
MLWKLDVVYIRTRYHLLVCSYSAYSESMSEAEREAYLQKKKEEQKQRMKEQMKKRMAEAKKVRVYDVSRQKFIFGLV